MAVRHTGPDLRDEGTQIRKIILGSIEFEAHLGLETWSDKNVIRVPLLSYRRIYIQEIKMVWNVKEFKIFLDLFRIHSGERMLCCNSEVHGMDD